MQYNVILSGLIYYSVKDNKQWNSVPLGINSLNYYNPFLITQLYYFKLTSFISFSNNFCSYNNTYLETSFIKNLNILIKNLIFNNYILNIFKPSLNKYRILIFSTLIVILAVIFKFKGIIAFKELMYLMLANI